MATPLVKSLVAIGTIGTASGVGTLVYLNTGTTVESKLNSENIKLIKDINDYKYHLFEHKDKPELKQALGKEKINYSEDTGLLKKWCNGKIKEWASNESIFGNVKSWCTVPTIRKLKDKLGSDLHDVSAWGTKYKAFADGNTKKAGFLEALKEQFKAITFSATTSEGGDKFKAWCEEALELNTYEVDQHKSEKNIKDWCFKS